MITANEVLEIAKNTERYATEIVLLEKKIRERAESGFTYYKFGGYILSVTQRHFESLGFRFTCEYDGTYILWGELK